MPGRLRVTGEALRGRGIDSAAEGVGFQSVLAARPADLDGIEALEHLPRPLDDGDQVRLLDLGGSVDVVHRRSAVVVDEQFADAVLGGEFYRQLDGEMLGHLVGGSVELLGARVALLADVEDGRTRPLPALPRPSQITVAFMA